MSRALVTGAAGFLGGHLASTLSSAGLSVRALDLHPPPDSLACEDFVLADVREPAAMRTAAGSCDIVVDNAALVPITRATPGQYRSVNVEGCRSTLDAATAAGAYVVHISSSAIFGVPRELPVTANTSFAAFEPYGQSKAQADRLVSERRDGGLTVASLRPRTLLGPGRLGIFDVIFARVRAGRRVPIFGRGANRVQMCDVRDFCAAVLAAIEVRANGDYNIGSAGYGTVREDMQALIDHAATGARVQPVPVAVIESVLRPLAAVGRSPFTEWHWRSAPGSFFFDIEEAKAELDWSPRYTNAEALVHAYEHYLQRAATGEPGSAHLSPLSGALARLLRG